MIGTRLSELCHSDSESPANILGYIYDEETKRRMRKEDEEEDYLDDSESKQCLLLVFLLFTGFHSARSSLSYCADITQM